MAKIEVDKNKFDVETMHKHRDTKSELSMIEGAMSTADKHRSELTDNKRDSELAAY